MTQYLFKDGTTATVVHAGERGIDAQLKAARAMLAALKLVRNDPNACMLSSATLNDIHAALAEAKAAGIGESVK